MTCIEVVGVTSPAFVFPGTASWWPLPERETTQLDNFFYRGVARLADGVTPAPGPVTNAAWKWQLKKGPPRPREKGPPGLR